MRKIYLVEDDHAIREVLEIFLQSEDYDVTSFASVSEFAKRNTVVRPDLYLFDVMLPDGSGIDLCKEIKSDVNNKHTPVIIMSANAQLHELKNLCEPDDFISKPFDLDNILEIIEEILNQKAS